MKHIALNRTLRNIVSSMPMEFQMEIGQGANIPKRHFYPRPEDNEAYVLPVKQSFVKRCTLDAWHKMHAFSFQTQLGWRAGQ